MTTRQSYLSFTIIKITIFYDYHLNILWNYTNYVTS